MIFTGGGTGGHLYPALAVARSLVRQMPEAEPFFVGARRGLESRILPDSGFPHLLLDLHPLYRSRPWNNWRTALGLVRALRTIERKVAPMQPRLIVSTGGYASSAMLGWGVLRGVPYVLQEQNSIAGMTVRTFSRWARAVYLAWPEAAVSLRGKGRRNAAVTGNPIEPPPSQRPDPILTRRAFGLPADGPVLLVFGGSQGSAALNERVDAWVTAGLPDGLNLLWATGPLHYEVHRGKASGRVVVRDYLSPISDAYAVTDVALTRAGAMTTAELCAWGIPMLLVPLPTAAADHQTANARALEAAGAARWLPEADATPLRIAAEISRLTSDPGIFQALAAGARARGRPEAASDIARRIVALLEGLP